MSPTPWISLALVLGLLVVPKPMESARILGLFPHPGESHFYFFEPILRQLDAVGHEVHIISHFEMKNVSTNFQNILVSRPGSTHNSVSLELFSTRYSFIHFLEFFMLRRWGRENCEITLQTPAVQELIRKRPKYDVILVEAFNSDCMLGMAHRINAPVISLSSCAMMPWHYSRMGNPQTPSLTPTLFMGYSDNMSFRQRISNWVAFYGMKILYYAFSDTDANSLVKKYIGEDVPDVRELAKKTSMYFVNQHYSLGGAKPLIPSVIELGGIHIKDQKPLEEELETFISSAQNGVIYISWGSMIKAATLPKDKLASIVKAIGHLKQRVVWKWDGEAKDIPNRPDNLYIGTWLPQRDILCHPNVKVFWMHGGYGGAAEAAHCGVPVVSTPMYGDQFLNSAAFENRGAGIVLPYEDISTDRILNALEFALSPQCVENSKKLAFAFNNRPLSPKDTAVYWIEHTIASGGQPLMKPISTSVSWYIYYGLDVISIVILGLIVLGYSWLWILRLCKKRPTREAEKLKKN